MERWLIRMMRRVRLVGVSTDVLPDEVGVVMKIEDMIIQSRLRWYGRRDIPCVETLIPKYVRL